MVSATKRSVSGKLAPKLRNAPSFSTKMNCKYSPTTSCMGRPLRWRRASIFVQRSRPILMITSDKTNTVLFIMDVNRAEN
jgi:hypothetical protein